MCIARHWGLGHRVHRPVTRVTAETRTLVNASAYRRRIALTLTLTLFLTLTLTIHISYGLTLTLIDLHRIGVYGRYR